MNIFGTFESGSPDATIAVARHLGEQLSTRAILALHGELGAGKTCFVQGLADALGLPVTITSPTYTLVNEYGDRAQLVHMDLYRMRSPDELFTLGIEDYLEGDRVVAIEWPERAGGYLPDDLIHISLKRGATDADRIITVRADTPTA